MLCFGCVLSSLVLGLVLALRLDGCVRESIGGGRVARGPASVPEESFTQGQQVWSLGVVGEILRVVMGLHETTAYRVRGRRD